MRTALLALLLIVVACGSPAKDIFIKEAGPEPEDVYVPKDGGPDVDTELGGPCSDDPQCNDGIDCTFDTCDKTYLRCRNKPDDTLCEDTVYCNGREICNKSFGCGAGPVVSCSKGNVCDIAQCVEDTKSCKYETRDVDQDGDPDSHCSGGGDCSDLDPSINSKHSEVCNNKVDDDCDGSIDESGCSSAANATCSTALAVAGSGTYALSTVAASKSYSASCGVTTPSSAHDVVAAITIPSGPNKDLDVWVTTTNYTEVAVALQSTCGVSSSELGCGAGGGSMTRARGRNLSPGTYYAIITSQTETTVELQVNISSATTKAANEDCSTGATLTPDVPTTVEIIDPAKDLASACTAPTGELTYTFTLSQAQDVKVFASTLKGSGKPVLGLRTSACTTQGDELRCRPGSSSLPLFGRNLAAGTYVVTVAATTPIDASILLKLYSPTSAPQDQYCSGAPSATVNGTLNFDLKDHEDAIKDGCMPGAPTAAYAFDLTQASDVLLVARYPQTEVGGVSLDSPGCTTSDKLVCGQSFTPVRVTKRNLATGSYRAVVMDQNGLAGSLTTLVRPTTASVAITKGDTCSSYDDISAGYYTGDTTGMVADWDLSCDSPVSPKFGAPDQVMRLVLSAKKRVVLSTDGSAYTTLLSLRQGSTCPGVELTNGCNPGFGAARSFIDMTLNAGTYWVMIDGYATAKGAWNLDVHIVDP